MKKLLIYTDAAIFGGSETVLENIVSYPPISKKYEITYCFARSHSYRSDLVRRGIDVPFRPISILTNSSLFWYIDRKVCNSFLSRMLKMPFRIIEKLHIYDFINYFILYQVICHEKPDAVHINNGGYPGAESCRIMALAAKKATVAKTVFTVNNMAVGQGCFVDRAIDRRIGEYVDIFTTASKAASRQLHEKRNFKPEKLKSIPRGVRHDGAKIDITKRLRNEFGIDKDVCIVGSVGLLIDRKGYHILIEAVKDMKPQKKFCVVIFGEGQRRDRLTRMIMDYNLEKKVFLPGHRNNIYDYLAEIDVFVLPSLYNEDHPNVISEAMLLGKPIVGTKIAVSEQVEHGKTGIIVEEGDVDALRKALQMMIDLEAEQRDEMGQLAAKKYRAEFSYQASMGKYLELYDSLLT